MHCSNDNLEGKYAEFLCSGKKKYFYKITKVYNFFFLLLSDIKKKCGIRSRGIEIKSGHNTGKCKARRHICPICPKIQWAGVGEMYSGVHDREQKGKHWAMYVLKSGICWGVKGLFLGPLCW